MRAPLIELENLSKSYLIGNGEFFALRDVNLRVRQGESVAIMGPSGSGKSTLLHILGCLDRPTKGTYSINGSHTSHLDDRALSHLRATQIGFVFQSFNLIPQLNVYENIETPLLYQPFPLSSNQMDARILNAVKSVKMDHRLHHLPSQLSGGEAQRIAIARALAIEPILILADEPTGNLDFETGNTILQLFQELNSQGSTLIIVTHDPRVAAHCHRMIYMQDGALYDQKP